MRRLQSTCDAASIFHFVLCLALSLVLTGCSSKSDDKGDQGNEGEAVTAREPIRSPVAPLEGKKIPVDIPLEALGGEDIKLEDLLAYRALVVYINTDTNDRQNRTATRMLRQVAKSAKATGFRLVVIFPKGSDPADARGWYKKRKVDRMFLGAIDVQGGFAEATGWEPRSVALMDDQGTIGRFWGPDDGWSARLGFDGFTDDFYMHAWALPEGGPELSAETQEAAIEVVRASLTKPSQQEGLPDALAGLASDRGLEQALEHPVYVSLFRKNRVGYLRGRHEGGTLGEGLVRATWDALRRAKGKGDEWRNAGAALRILVEVSGKPFSLPTRDLRSLWFMVEPGVHGLIMRQGTREAVLLPSEAITSGLLTPRVVGRDKKLNKMMDELSKRLKAPPRSWEKEDDIDLLRFQVTSFATLDAKGTVGEVVRANQLMDHDPDSAEILEAIRHGGRWLLERVGPDGKFDYEYIPHQDKWTSGYNIVRHAGSVYGLLEMWDLTQEERLLRPDADDYMDAVARSIGYVFEGLDAPRRAKQPGRLCLLDPKGRCDSGAAALTLLTLLARPEPGKVPEKYRSALYPTGRDAAAIGLGRTLVDMIDDKGQVWRRYEQAMTQRRVKKEPLYYPGESMLALLRLHEKTGDRTWLEAAQKIGEHQLELYEGNRFRWPDHWVMQGLDYLCVQTGSESCVKAAYEMATHSSSQQYGHLWSPYPDYFGGWRRTNDTPRTTRAGSRCEAIRAVVELAWKRGDDATIWEDSLLFATRHLIEQQFKDGNMWWVPNEAPARGCFPMGIVDRSCRIDNNQHGLVGMVGALHVARRREAGGKP